jgi:7-cyano-7-deazaguanine synthase
VSLIVLVSGGMDSVTLAHRVRTETAHDEPLLFLSFNYGQKHIRELHFAKRAAARLHATHKIIRLPNLDGSALTDPSTPIPEGHYADESMRSTVVPNRNMILLAHAISIGVHKGARGAAVAVHAGDRDIYPDCRPEFIDAMIATARIANHGFIDPEFKIYAPFLHCTKADIVSQGDRLGVPWAETWTCYQGGALHCGRCGSCTERREAFFRASVTDPTEYEETSEIQDHQGL